MKHTPGPWRIAMGGSFRVIGPGTTGTVLEIGDAHRLIPGNADARLIAAAPDLFAALDPRSLEVIADEIDGTLLGKVRAASLRAMAANQRAALAKVER